MFHPKCGDRIKLSNGNRTATRNASEFNFGLVFSSEPLAEEELFEIKIDKKVCSWIGSLEMGVTSSDPEGLVLPASATDLRSGSWILSGKSVLRDGRTLVESYPLNLDKIVEGEKIGMMRTADGELEFFVNGISHGVAAVNIPRRVFAVIDVYGKVSQVTVMPKQRVSRVGERRAASEECEDVAEPTSGSEELDARPASPPHHRPRFHDRTGSLVKLSCGGRVAERMRPTDEFNNAVVMTHRPLLSDTLFEIRIDRLVEKWSGSIEVGVTTHDPGELDFPATMTNMRSGTVMMSGCGILTNGKGTKREYGEYNLDELRVGDRIGMMRKSNGDLHYFINGLDQGVAALHVPELVWGVVDLYGMTVKVTIVDRDEREEQNLITRRNTVLRENALTSSTAEPVDEEIEDRLLFHPSCGSHAAVINNGRTAHRPNALDDFNNAVVLTNRPLKTNEVFEVRIDKMVTKWAGSIEIGVTTHAPTELEYPSTMTNVRSGTWIMTGNGVMHNGTSVIDDYGQNLDRLQGGDRVGVVIREGGSLHFVVNGEDQGEAGTGLPPGLHAVIDLYGQASQASIVSHCPSCSSRPASREIHFHGVHGRNVRVSNGGRTASRPRASVEFNDAVVVTNRPLRAGEMFAVVVERIVDRWSGSIEAGVTAIQPDDLELPGTMTDLDHDTWMLSGFAVMRGGVTVRHGYGLDLDKVRVGSVIGLKRHHDGSLHYYLDGVDRGEACSAVPEQLYPVLDLYGQCAQVSIVSSSEPEPEETNQVPSRTPSEATVLPDRQLSIHKLWSEVGKWLCLDETETVARRAVSSAGGGGLLFGAAPLATGSLFEFSVEALTPQWAGSLALGLTLAAPPPRPPTDLHALKEPTWYIAGCDVFRDGELTRRGYCPSLQWLRPGNRLGMKRGRDGSFHLYIDGVDQGVAAHNLPEKLYAVIDLYGAVSAIKMVSQSDGGSDEAPLAVSDAESPCDKHLEGSGEEGKKSEDTEKSVEDGDPISEVDDLEIPGEMSVFHECHGRNVQVSESRMAARRVSSYNQGIVILNRPLARGQLLQIRLESLNPRWVSSLSVGVTSVTSLSSTLPVTALGLKKDSWIVAGDRVYHNGHMEKSRYGPNLDSATIGSLIGIMIDEGNNLRLFVNGIDQGIAATDVPKHCLPVVDLYGMCDQVSIASCGSEGALSPTAVQENSRVDWGTGTEKGETEKGEKPLQGAAPPPDASRSKSDKMNENIQCSSAVSPILDHPKAIASSENLTLQMQNAERRAEQNSSSNSFVKSPTVVVRSVGGSLAVTPVAPAPVKPTSCDYLGSVLRLKAFLGLPNGFFEAGSADCECAGCTFGRGPNKEVGGSEGGGWVRLPLRRRSPSAEGGTDQWHVAFATTALAQVRSVLDTGEITTADVLGLGQRPGRRWTDKKDDACDSAQLVLSPTLLHAAAASSCPKYQFTDPKTKSGSAAYAAFQLLVRPGSYKVGHGADPLAWVTKERNATQLAALLLRLETV